MGNLALKLKTPFRPGVDFSYIQFSLEHLNTQNNSDRIERYEHKHITYAKNYTGDFNEGIIIHTYTNVRNVSYMLTVNLLDSDFRCVATYQTQGSIASHNPNIIYITERIKQPTFVITGSDLELEDKSRRKSGRSSLRRRALVHDFGDGLTLNWNKDYPGGLTFNGKALFKDESKFIENVDFGKPIKVNEDIILRINRHVFSKPQLGKEGRNNTTLPPPLSEIADISLKQIIQELNNRISELEQKVAQLSQP